MTSRSDHASAARTGPSVFERARDKVSIPDYLGQHSVKLSRQGRGPCVLCDSGTTKFRVMEGGLKFRCYGCDKHGDVVDLVALHRRCEPYDAARWLLGEDVPVSAPRERKPEAPKGSSTSDKVAGETWGTARAFAGSLAERYLLGRGIAADLVALAGLRLRYHPAAKHHWDDKAREWVRAPAMVGQVETPEGPTGGIHCTYLDRATAGKAALSPAKVMWGPQSLNGVTGGVWLIGPDLPEGWPAADLIDAEGIETSLSVATLAWRKGQKLRSCAALSLGRLQGGIQADKEGCIDPWQPQANPLAPAFTWPSPDVGGWGQVLVAVDRDMKDQRVRARNGRGRPIDMRLTAEDRARICGRLAVDAWKAAGAASAKAIAPPPGLDFNDELRRVLALECA